MQFIASGPDIPDELLQAQEDGRLVFFCGAGISYPAGLPDFRGLVNQIYAAIGTEFSEVERAAFCREEFDTALELLQRRIPAQRLALRSAIAETLEPRLRRKGATETHAALLRLAQSREGRLRLVTTNFDRVFQAAARRAGLRFKAYTAPMLPIPKSSRWDGLVYLHGLLPKRTDQGTPHELVVTSGDFGRAYLTERWASRFVTELFRNYVVCFVGYSIKDPVMRYMMDAIAADRMLGEVTPQAWALADFKTGQAQPRAIEWKIKGVEPILYEVPEGDKGHNALHQTLQAWARIHRDGVLGKERIVVSHALSKPSSSTQQDDFVGRMLWALSDKSGLPARRFADFNPAPSLDWLLEAFSIKCFYHRDLARSGIPPHSEPNASLLFSLIHRPASYERAPPMLLASDGACTTQWDDVMYHLARWLVRHLDDPRLLIWIAERGGQLHDRWQWLIESQLDHICSLERAGRAAELSEIRLQAPSAIPRPLMRTLWRLLLSGRVKSGRSSHSLYRWIARLKREGLTTTLRLELRELLSPQVALKSPFRWDLEEGGVDRPTRVDQLVGWELVLATTGAPSDLQALTDDAWTSARQLLLEDFQHLLLDALDLRGEMGAANSRSDGSHWDLPSIVPHWQNRGFSDWVGLIELLREAWLAVHSQDSARAARIAQEWFELPFPTFKRLALFAASHSARIAPRQWVCWLLTDGAWWLWSSETIREVCRLLVLQGHRLTGPTLGRLEAAIQAGPPLGEEPGNLDPGEWQYTVARAIWLRLAKLKAAGLTLGASARARLEELSSANPLWQLMGNEREEFSHWMSGTGDPDYEDSQEVDIAPRKRQELVHWLKKPTAENELFYQSTWREVCRSRFFHSLCALKELAESHLWPVSRWREALQVWSEDGMVQRSWRYAATVLQAMPEGVLLEAAHSVAYWIKAASKATERHEAILLDLCRRLLALPLEDATSNKPTERRLESPVSKALNHPVGYVAEALINRWLRRGPNDNDRLPADIRPFFTELCDSRMDRFRHGRVILASRLISLFRVDSSWTTEHLLPLFRWSGSNEAASVWAGFLSSLRLYQPLLVAFKPHFLETAYHYVDLPEYQEHFAVLLTYIALEPPENYTIEELRSAMNSLSQEGLESSAFALVQALEGAADQREHYWRDRIKPFWKQAWPKALQLATPRIAEPLAQLVIAAGDEFPVALVELEGWLRPIDNLDHVVKRLRESGLCKRFPKQALRLLDVLIADQLRPPQELGQCLEDIEKASPELANDPTRRRLNEYRLRHKV